MSPGSVQNIGLIHRVACYIDKSTRSSLKARQIPSYLPLKTVLLTDKQYNVSSILREYKKVLQSPTTSWIGDLKLVDCITGGRTRLADLGFVIGPHQSRPTSVSTITPRDSTRVTCQSQFILFLGSHTSPKIQIWTKGIPKRRLTIVLSQGDALLIRSGVRYRHLPSDNGSIIPYAIFHTKVRQNRKVSAFPAKQSKMISKSSVGPSRRRKSKEPQQMNKKKRKVR